MDLDVRALVHSFATWGVRICVALLMGTHPSAASQQEEVLQDNHIPSLFFPEEETENTPSLPGRNVSSASNTLTLEGLVYVSPQQWTVWINGKSYRPGESPYWGTILAVTDTAVTVRLAHGQVVQLTPYKPIPLP